MYFGVAGEADDIAAARGPPLSGMTRASTGRYRRPSVGSARPYAKAFKAVVGERGELPMRIRRAAAELLVASGLGAFVGCTPRCLSGRWMRLRFSWPASPLMLPPVLAAPVPRDITDEKVVKVAASVGAGDLVSGAGVVGAGYVRLGKAGAGAEVGGRSGDNLGREACGVRFGAAVLPADRIWR